MRMKVKKLFFTVIAAVALSACGQSEDAKEPEANPQEKEDVGNKENVKAVVEAVNSPDTRYKLSINDEADIFVISDVFIIDGTSYGYDDPDNIGTSVYAYADKKELNQEQADALEVLASPLDDDLKEITENYSDDFKDGEFPYQGVDLDYVTLSNVETKESMAGEEITADITVHWHSVDGEEKTETFETSAEPEMGDTELDEEKVEEALSADVMNEEIPTEERFIYVDE